MGGDAQGLLTYLFEEGWV